jgi:hypothetical protein
MSNSTGLAPTHLPDPAEWNGYSTAPCAAIALGLAVIAVALRFWARAGIVRLTGLEDWFILTSLVFSAAITACVGLGMFTMHCTSTCLARGATLTTFGRAAPWTGETCHLR